MPPAHPRFPTLIAAALALVSLLTPHALAQRHKNRTPDPTPAEAPAPAPHPSADAIGLEFREQEVSDAIGLLEDGKITEAIDLMKKAQSDSTVKSEERKRELRAGLGLLYARAGDFGNANQNVHGLSDRDDGTTLGPRCKAIELAVAKASKLGPEIKARLKDRAEWLTLLAGVRRDCETRFRTLHDEAHKTISSERWSSVRSPAKKAYELAAVMEAIHVKDQGAADDALLEHARQLASEIELIASAGRSHRQTGDSLRQQIDSMRARKDGGRFSLIDTYNRHRADIQQARDAARALSDELRSAITKNPARLRGQKVPEFNVIDLPYVEKE